MEELEEMNGFETACTLCDEVSKVFVNEICDERPVFCPMCGTEARFEPL